MAESAYDGTWWTRDMAGRGNSAFNVHERTPTGLQWIKDADENGDYIDWQTGKVGLAISSRTRCCQGVDRMTITDAAEFVLLRSSTNPEECRRAATDTASIETWREIIEQYPDMAVWVAQNKTIPMDILEMLAVHPEAHVRHMVAMKRKASSTILDKIAHGPDDFALQAVVRNRNTSPATLEYLATSGTSVSQMAFETLKQREE